MDKHPASPVATSGRRGALHLAAVASLFRLAIVRRAAEAHGGEVAVGAAPTGGACFRVALPRDGGVR